MSMILTCFLAVLIILAGKFFFPEGKTMDLFIIAIFVIIARDKFEKLLNKD